MKMIRIAFSFALIFTSFFAFSQTETVDLRVDYVRNFLDSQNATEEERLYVQCEMVLLYEQYDEHGIDENELNTAFLGVLATYRASQELNTSYRLHEPSHAPRTFEEFSEINLTWVPQTDVLSDRSGGCINADFETGAMGNWAMSHGTYNTGNLNINIPSADEGPINSATGYQHTIMGPGAGNDPNTGNVVPRVYPGGGGYSLRLGDAGTGRKAARATYTFEVTQQTELFLYHYAVVMQDPGHSTNEQPFMSINLWIGNTAEPCGYFYQAATANAPGFQSHGSIRYKNWETMSIPLTQYMGQTATIEFVTADCSLGGHYGYAYIDAECMPMPSLETEMITCANPTPTLSAPPGADSYLWTGPGIIGANNTQDIQVNQPGTYEVQIIPVQGPHCAYTLEIQVGEQLGEIDVDFNAIPPQVCLGESINFESSIVMTGDTGPIQTYDWQFGDGNSAGTEHTSHTYTAPGTYNVSFYAISTTGCEDIITKQVEVSPIPVADFTVAPVCNEDNSVFNDASTVNPIDGNVIDSWSWDFGDGNSSTAQNPSHIYADENVYNVTLTVETNKGCTNSFTTQATVYPLPLPDFSTVPVCLEEATSFVDQSGVSNNHTSNQITDWAWDFGDGNTSTAQNPFHTYQGEGFYTTTLTLTTNNGCVASTTDEITIYPLPLVDFSPTEVCLNSLTEFTDESTVSNVYTSNQITEWAWDFADGNTSTAQNPVHTYGVEGIYGVSLTVTTNHDCEATDVIDVTVFPNPYADFDIDSVCVDLPSVFTDLSTINTSFGDYINAWNWSFGDGNTSTNSNPTHTYALENVYTVTLTVTSDKGCEHEVSKNTAIYPRPVVNFSPTEVCLEEATDFTDLSTISNQHTVNSIVSWNWDFADGTTSNLQHPTHTYLNDGVFGVELSLVTNNDCTASAIIPVTVNPLPIVHFVGEDIEGCSPICPTITSTTTINNPGNISKYTWELSNGEVYEGSSPSFTTCLENDYGFDISFDVRLTAESDKGCIRSHEEINYINVYHNPVADFAFTPREPDVTNTIIKFENTSLYGDYYEWHIDGAGVTTVTHPTVEYPDKPNVYNATLIVTTDKGCKDSITRVIDIKDRLIFYVPNTFTPDNDNFNEVFKPIFRNGYDPQTYTLYIFNRWGELLFQSHDTEVGWDGTYGVDRDKTVRDGTYIWKIEFKESMSDRRHTYTGHVNILR